MKKIVILLICAITYFFIGIHSSLAEIEYECGETVPTDPTQLQEYIDSCNTKLNELSGQKKTLSQAIAYFNTQIGLTQAKISSTQKELEKLNEEIVDLTGKISSIDYSLTDLTRMFVARVRETYIRQGSWTPASILQAGSIPEAIRRAEYEQRLRDRDREIMISLEKSRLDYNNQKEEKEKKQVEVEKLKKQLDVQKVSLASQKAEKDRLLAETQNDEKRYQSLRQEARNRVAQLANYARSRGGASLLSGTTKCDDWGCYYNQRDSQWGLNLIGDSDMNLATVGCLVTSAAMVASHYGKNLTPADIAASTSPFEYDTADMRFTWLDSVNGSKVSRTPVSCNGNGCFSVMDSELSAGRPVIARITAANVAGTHFIVITRKEGDNYIMKDPFEPDGNNIPFTQKHSVNSLTRVDRVTVQ